MNPKNSIRKKVSPKANSTILNPIPFLDRPLQSILRFMQENRKNIEINRKNIEVNRKNIKVNEQPTQNLQSSLEPKITIFEHPYLKDQPSLYEQDPENYMYYNLKNKYPFDPLSLKQMDVFGGTFSNEINKEALIRVSPVCLTNSRTTFGAYNEEVVKSVPYSAPIGPLSFLSSTVPYRPQKNDLDFLDYLSRK